MIRAKGRSVDAQWRQKHVPNEHGLSKQGSEKMNCRAESARGAFSGVYISMARAAINHIKAFELPSLRVP